LAAGIVFNLLADQALKAYSTTVKPFEKSDALVITGIYKLSRNPMHFGMSMIIAGISIVLGSLTPLLMIPLFVIIIDRRFITKEEKMLLKQYGKVFDQYKQKVCKWF
jgi:protein-S-isoprenylcysteine O-methyltransferase Ste14